jgi:hypothetical protein
MKFHFPSHGRFPMDLSLNQLNSVYILSPYYINAHYCIIPSKLFYSRRSMHTVFRK